MAAEKKNIYLSHMLKAHDRKFEYENCKALEEDNSLENYLH